MQMKQAYLILPKPGLCNISCRIITIPALQGQLLAFPALHRSSSRCSSCSFSNSNSPLRLPQLPVRTYSAKVYIFQEEVFRIDSILCCVHAHSSLLIDGSEISTIVLIRRAMRLRCSFLSYLYVWLTYADIIFLNQAMQQQAQQVQQLRQTQAHVC